MIKRNCYVIIPHTTYHIPHTTSAAKSQHLHILRGQSEELVLIPTDNPLILPLDPEAKYKLVDEQDQWIEKVDIQYQEGQVELSASDNIKVILKSPYPTPLLTESTTIADGYVFFDSDVLAKYVPIDFEQSVLYKSLFGTLAVAGVAGLIAGGGSKKSSKDNATEETTSAESSEVKTEPKTPVEPESQTKPEAKKETKVETPKAEGSKTVTPKAETPKAETPKTVTPKAEAPKAEEPKVEAPKTEAPKAEEPKAEAPKTEAPKAEEPKAEVPNKETPKAEEPKAEAPNTEAPKTEEPKAEAPNTETPKAEEPKAEEPKTEAPKAEEPKAEVPKTEAPKAEEPKAEVPKTEAPKAEEPKAEEPKTEAPKAEEPKAEVPKARLPKPRIAINNLNEYNQIDHEENQGEMTISGTTENVPDGNAISLRIGEQTLETIVNDGKFSLEVSRQLLVENNKIKAFVTVSDAGNSISSSEYKYYGVNHGNLMSNVTFDDITEDNLITHTESEGKITVSGSIENVADGKTIFLDIGDHRLETTVTGGKFSLEVDGQLLADNRFIDALIIDNLGHQAFVGGKSYQVDHGDAKPVITFDKITEDNRISHAESEGLITISGTAENVPNGNVVYIEIGDQTREATVVDGKFSLEVSGQLLAENNYIYASTIDSLGHKIYGVGNQSYELDHGIPRPTITLNDVSEDNKITHEEINGQITISGSAENVPDGSVVSLRIGHKSDSPKFEAIVNDGKFSVKVSGQLFSENYGNISASVAIVDDFGHKLSADGYKYVQLDHGDVMPVITLDSVTDDDRITHEESKGNITISGTTENVPNGSVISLEIGSEKLNTTVSDGKFSVEVSGRLLMENNSNYINASIIDDMGHSLPFYYNLNYQVDHGDKRPTIRFDNVTEDNRISHEEIKGNITISGTTENVPDGNTISLRIGNETFDTTVSDGKFSLEVSGRLLTNNYQINASTTVLDELGHSLSVSEYKYVPVDHSDKQPIIRLDDVTGDNLITHEESKGNITISGTTENVPDGSVISLRIGTNFDNPKFEAIVNDSKFSVEVSGALLANNDQINASARVFDELGHELYASDYKYYQLDHGDKRPTIRFDDVSDDNRITHEEIKGNITISGSTENVPDGNAISLRIGNETLETTVSDGKFSLDVSGVLLANNYQINASATVLDELGHSLSASGYKYVQVEHNFSPIVRFDDVTEDNRITHEESKGNITISGSTENVPDGSVISLRIGYNSQKLETTVNDGKFSLDVSGQLLAENYYLGINASIIDELGHSVSASGPTKYYQLDHGNEQPIITFDNVTEDNRISHEEIKGNITISGTTENVPDGKTINLSVGGQTFETRVSDGKFSLDVSGQLLAENYSYNYGINASVGVLDGFGHSIYASSTKNYELDHSDIQPVITLNNITEDNRITLSERGEQITISGTTENIPDGSTISLRIGAGYETLETTVSDGKFSLDINGHLLGDYSSNINASVSFYDDLGHLLSANGSKDYVVNLYPRIVFDNINEDNRISHADSEKQITISGITENMPDDSVISLRIGSETFETTAVGGKFSLEVSGQLLLENNSVSASATDGSISYGSGYLSYSVDHGISQPLITLDNVTEDNRITSEEREGNITISGTTENLPDGSIISLVVGYPQTSLEATVIDDRFSIEVSGQLVAEYYYMSASATIYDDWGHSLSASASKSYGYGVI